MLLFCAYKSETYKFNLELNLFAQNKESYSMTFYYKNSYLPSSLSFGIISQIISDLFHQNVVLNVF